MGVQEIDVAERVDARVDGRERGIDLVRRREDDRVVLGQRVAQLLELMLALRVGAHDRCDNLLHGGGSSGVESGGNERARANDADRCAREQAAKRM